MKTGLFVRTKVDGKWGSHDIAELSDEELDGFIKGQRAELDNGPDDRGWAFAKALAVWIRDNVIGREVEEE